MDQREIENISLKKQYRILKIAIAALFLYTCGFFYYLFNPSCLDFNSKEVPTYIDDDDRIENGIHVSTGLIEAEGLMLVVNNCTNCHSSKLVIQNRMNEDGWNQTIKWMQETQNLWDLGENQKPIVDYLVTNYPPRTKGRRMVLKDIEWYDLYNE